MAAESVPVFFLYLGNKYHSSVYRSCPSGLCVVSQHLLDVLDALLGKNTWLVLTERNDPVRQAVYSSVTSLRIATIEEEVQPVVPASEPAELPCKGCGQRGTGTFVRTAFVCSECNYLLGGF